MVKKMLHPGVRWMFRIGLLWSILFFTIFFGFFLFSFVGALYGNTDPVNIFLNTFFILIGLVIFFMIIAEIWVRMYYNRFFYEFTDSNLKLERGVIWKRYSNVPYERVQNVDITRGIIARILGFSTVNIQTAGYAAPTGGRGAYTEGYIPGVNINEAEQIRDFLMKRISKKGHQGL